MPPAAPLIDVTTVFEGQTHIAWATEKAAAEAHKRGFRSGTHEEAELIAAAHLILCKRAHTFQPDRVPEGGSADGLFRGWVARSLKFEMWKVTLRLRCGGAYHSIPDEKEKQAIRATALPTHVNELGEEEVWVSDYREPEEREETPEPVASESCTIPIEREPFGFRLNGDYAGYGRRVAGRARPAA